ncbi:hypothetical protein MNBD_GAMMA12-2383 [hydrothermal vent metagenome]|uniref:DUF2169 domain-containing protein n=1 Tax=hydrothermal vent metagenome TaxID=652676 RepID=A0A3B0XT46_9ZZZZ
MLELANQSSWAAGLYPGWGKNREFQFTLVVKQSFEFDLTGQLTPLDEPVPVQTIDEHYGEPLKTSLKAANEIAPFKQGGEIIIQGTAYPHKAGATASPVSVEITGDNIHWKKKLVVSGIRHWKRSLMGMKAAEPTVLEPTPMIYENAYGGVHPENEEDYQQSNPVGKGHIGKNKSIVGTELPPIELINSFIKSPKDTPLVAGFGPIPVFWAPRDILGQDIDEQAAQIGECHYGQTIPENLFNSAPKDQQFEQCFTGNEIIILNGLFESVTTAVSIRLNFETPDIILLETDEEEYLTPLLDTIVINTDEQQLHCVWRSALAHERSDTEISWVYVRDELTNQQLEHEMQRT